MKPKWQKLASLAQEICTLYFQFFGAVFASKGYPFKIIINLCIVQFMKHVTARSQHRNWFKPIYIENLGKKSKKQYVLLTLGVHKIRL